MDQSIGRTDFGVLRQSPRLPGSMQRTSFKAPKIHGPQPLPCDAQGSRSAITILADAVERYPSSAKDSEPEDADPQIPVISPLQIGNNQWRTGKILVNGFFAFKFKTGKSQSLRYFTNVVAQAMCAGEGEEAEDGQDGRTRAEKQ